MKKSGKPFLISKKKIIQRRFREISQSFDGNRCNGLYKNKLQPVKTINRVLTVLTGTFFNSL
jgi:hypothetical protein